MEPNLVILLKWYNIKKLAGLKIHDNIKEKQHTLWLTTLVNSCIATCQITSTASSMIPNKLNKQFNHQYILKN